MEIERVKIEHYKSISIYFMAIAGGQITLLGSVFSEYSQKGFAVLAIFLMLLASLFSYSISDVAVKRISPAPNFNNIFWEKVYNLGPSSNEFEYIKSVVAACLFAISVGFYSWFVLKELTF